MPMVVDHRGCLLLPPSVCQELGVSPGMLVDAQVEDGRLVLVPRRPILTS